MNRSQKTAVHQQNIYPDLATEKKRAENHHAYSLFKLFSCGAHGWAGCPYNCVHMRAIASIGPTFRNAQTTTTVTEHRAEIVTCKPMAFDHITDQSSVSCAPCRFMFNCRLVTLFGIRKSCVSA